MSEYLGNLGYVLYLHLHILLFIYSTVSLVNLANYLEPWADIQVSSISLVNWASYQEPWADIQVSAICLGIQCRLRWAVWSGSTLFAIPSAPFGLITLWKSHIVQILEWQQINILGVQIFRKFTVCFVPPSSHSYVHILNHISCKLGQLSRALGWYSNLNHISCNLGQLSRALCWYSSLNHISCKLGQPSWALGWYSSLNHISCKLCQLSRTLGLIFKSQPYLL